MIFEAVVTAGSTTMSTPYEKCHFDLDLNASKCKDKKQFEFRIKTLMLYLLEEISPLQLAIRNLLGVMYYYSGQYHKAYESFSCVLKHDEDNLNALENIARVCFRLQNSREEEEYRRRYEMIVNNKPGVKIRARFRAEHAFAHAFGCYLETNELRRYPKSNEIYIDCLEMTSNMTDMNQERAEWKMCMIWNYKKIFNRNFTMDQQKEKNEKLYPKILEVLFDILNLVPGDQYFGCLVRGYLGYFSWKRPILQNETAQDKKDMPIPEIVKKNGMEKEFQDPELLFREALKERDELEVLQLFAGWLQSKRYFDEALNVLNKCVEMKPIGSNYFSYLKRGEILLSKAEKILNGKDGSISSVENYLDKAIADFEFVATVNPTSYLFGHLGSAYCLRSDKGRNRQMKANCLGAFERGFDCLDGRLDHRIHFKHADCLRQFGEDDHALQATKRCIECQNAKAKDTNDIKFLLEWYIEKIASGTPEILNEAIPDLVHWFIVAFNKYDRYEFKTMFTNLIIGQCRKLKLDIFTQLFLKQDTEINQFFVEVFQKPEVISACKDFGVGLSQIFSTVVTNKPNKSLTHSKNLQPRNRSGFDYDFFVIYCDKDRKWVSYSLLDHLENTRGFKAFFDHRDFEPGKTIIDNIETAIKKSYKFILVITPDFKKSSWCQHETQAVLTAALNKKEKGSIIPIVKDGEKVPEFLKTLHHISLEESLNEFQLERLAMALNSNPY